MICDLSAQSVRSVYPFTNQAEKFPPARMDSSEYQYSGSRYRSRKVWEIMAKICVAGQPLRPREPPLGGDHDGFDNGGNGERPKLDGFLLRPMVVSHEVHQDCRNLPSKWYEFKPRHEDYYSPAKPSLPSFGILLEVIQGKQLEHQYSKYRFRRSPTSRHTVNVVQKRAMKSKTRLSAASIGVCGNLNCRTSGNRSSMHLIKLKHSLRLLIGRRYRGISLKPNEANAPKESTETARLRANCGE